MNVTDGHLAAIRVKLSQPATLDQVREAMASFTSLPQQLKLHSAPEKPINCAGSFDITINTESTSDSSPSGGSDTTSASDSTSEAGDSTAEDSQ